MVLPRNLIANIAQRNTINTYLVNELLRHSPVVAIVSEMKLHADSHQPITQHVHQMVDSTRLLRCKRSR